MPKAAAERRSTGPVCGPAGGSGGGGVPTIAVVHLPAVKWPSRPPRLPEVGAATDRQQPSQPSKAKGAGGQQPSGSGTGDGNVHSQGDAALPPPDPQAAERQAAFAALRDRRQLRAAAATVIQAHIR